MAQKSALKSGQSNRSAILTRGQSSQIALAQRAIFLWSHNGPSSCEVRFGSLADIAGCSLHVCFAPIATAKADIEFRILDPALPGRFNHQAQVRFTPESRHQPLQPGCPLRAKSRHMQRSKSALFDLLITNQDTELILINER